MGFTGNPEEPDFTPVVTIYLRRITIGYEDGFSIIPLN